MKKEIKTVLIIAEDKQVKSVLARFLAERCDLITAASGEAGLQRLSQIKKIDLVFLEHELSDIKGLTVLGSIRKTQQEIPVVFIMGSRSVRLASEAVEWGIFAYLTKPLRDSDVERIISKILCANPAGGKSDVECAREFIENHFTERITVKDIAAACTVCYRHIARKFKQTEGCVIMEYVKRRRVERAKELLIEGRMFSYEIALAVGFSSPRSFCAAFKSVIGVTPHQFQREATRSEQHANPTSPISLHPF